MFFSLFMSFKADAATDDHKKFNVLFLVVDDLNTWLLANPDRYAGKVIAPNILRLAASGVLFKQASCAASKCCPSRSSFLSGVAPWKSGIYDNGVETDSKVLVGVTSLPELFKQQGYFTSSAGKIAHGWDPGKEAWDDKINHKRDPAPPNAPLNGWAKAKGGKVTESDWGPTHLPESEMNDTKVVDHAIEQLKQAHTKPFFIACGLFHPHMPWYVPQKYLDMYPLADVKLPELNPKDLDDIPKMGIALNEKGAYESVISHDQYKSAVQAYLACTTYVDAQMGRILDALESSPYKDNTIVVLLSDHGFHLGEKEHWQKGTLWEEATQCLLMFRVPGITKINQQCTRPVTLLDLYPTLVELAGLPKPAHLDGYSLVPLLKAVDAPRSEPALTAFAGHISVRTDKYRFIRYKDGTTELYSRIKDPHEWTNQTNDPEYGSIKSELAAYLPALDKMAPEMKSKSGKEDDN